MKHSITLLSLIVAASFSVNAQVANNLHDRSVAKQRYDSFKSGSSSDPLEDIRRSYGISYSNSLANGINDDRSSIKNQILMQENERISSFIQSLSSSRDEQRRRIYQSSINEGGTVDYEAFANSYSGYLLDNQDSVRETMGGRGDFAYDIMSRTSHLLQEAGDAHSTNANIAAHNIIDIINNDTIEYANQVTEKLDAAVSQTLERVPVGAEALRLSYIFDGECGETCSFPPVVEPEPECSYDTRNYISIYESESTNGWDEWYESEGEVWRWSGTTIYEMRYEDGDRMNTYRNTRGSMNGYRIGSRVDEDSYYNYGNGYRSMEDRYYICKE